MRLTRSFRTSLGVLVFSVDYHGFYIGFSVGGIRVLRFREKIEPSGSEPPSPKVQASTVIFFFFFYIFHFQHEQVARDQKEVSAGVCLKVIPRRYSSIRFRRLML